MTDQDHSDTGPADVNFEVRDRVAIITINRPNQHNCINELMAGKLRDAFDNAEGDDDIRSIILTGAGDSFSSGLDLKKFAERGADIIPEVIFEDTGWAGIGKRKRTKPMIAAVNGLALAGGLELALSADFIFASERAFFGVNEVSLGPIADAGACFRLPQWVPLPFAREMLFTGRRVPAEEALRVGLANRVVPHDRLLDDAMETAALMARNSRSSMQITIQLIRETLNIPEDDAWVVNDRYMLASFETGDFLKGALAFTNKTETEFES